MTPSGSLNTVNQRYKLLEPVGRGGFGYTYRAVDLWKNRTVAIKYLKRELAQDPAVLARFKREAQFSVRSPYVVEVLGSGEDHGAHYLVTEWINGPNLREIIRERAPMEVDDVRQLITDVLWGLSDIHSAGIVHRDLKPGNILVTRNDGMAKIADFGIAHAALDTSLTQSGQTIGTAAYMAPEQAQGRTPSPASDLYSVAVVLFEMMTGSLPFPGPHPAQILYHHVHESPPNPRRLNPSIPDWLESIILRGLEKRPEDRFPNALAMRRALISKEKVNLRPWPHTPPGSPSPADRPTRHQRGPQTAMGTSRTGMIPAPIREASRRWGACLIWVVAGFLLLILFLAYLVQG